LHNSAFCNDSVLSSVDRWLVSGDGVGRAHAITSKKLKISICRRGLNESRCK